MRKLKTFDSDLWLLSENRERVKELGLDTTLGVFQALKAHLEEVGMLPDGEFRLCDREPKPMFFYCAARCEVNFSEPDGVFFSIYLSTYGPGDMLDYEFAVGNTQGSSAEDYMRMCRIAAECSLMFNGQGREFEMDYNAPDHSVSGFTDKTSIGHEQDKAPELTMQL